MSYDSDLAMRRAIERLRARARDLRVDDGTRSDATDKLALAQADYMDRIAADLEAALPPETVIAPAMTFPDD